MRAGGAPAAASGWADYEIDDDDSDSSSSSDALEDEDEPLTRAHASEPDAGIRTSTATNRFKGVSSQYIGEFRVRAPHFPVLIPSSTALLAHSRRHGRRQATFPTSRRGLKRQISKVFSDEVAAARHWCARCVAAADGRCR